MRNKCAFICLLGGLLTLSGGHFEAWGKGTPGLPRFACLRSNKVNIRVGPGNSYPIEWVMEYKHFPVKIIAEYEHWRQIQDHEGTLGWVHQSTLTGKRHVAVRDPRATLRRSPDENGRPVAFLEQGLVMEYKKESGDFCLVKVRGFGGWVEKKSLWGF
jgi:SH3-like domain-containing protein